MEKKIIKHGNHIINNETDGYVYNFNTSRGYSFNSHIHKCYEFIHIIRGELIYTIEGKEYMLHDGDLIMTNPNELHSFTFPKESDYQREFLHIYPDFVKNCPGLTNGLNSRKFGYFNRFPKKMVEKYEIDKIFRDIERCCTKAEPETDHMVYANTVMLFSKINQMLRKEAPEHQIIEPKKANAAVNYIDRHYKEALSNKTIADALYMSVSHLNRIFKEETGMTVKSYLNLRRVIHAKNLIVAGQQMTKNIYLECGFGDYSTFYRSFVKHVGMSPKEFRDSNAEAWC